MPTKVPTNTHPNKTIPHNTPPSNTTVATLNCRGIRTSWEIILLAINKYQPDILILTETKLHTGLTKHFSKTITQDLPNYTHHHSSITLKTASQLSTNLQQQPTRYIGAGGVLLLIHKNYQHHLIKQEVPPATAGSLAHVTIEVPGHNTIHILGTYMPHDNPNTTKATYTHIGNIIRNHAPHGDYILAGGDWNATMYPTDRSNSEFDPMHAQNCHDIDLHPTNPNNRAKTYQYYQYNTSGSSRIDDILIHPKPTDKLTQEITYQAGGNLDHLLLLQNIPHTTLPLWPTQVHINTHTPNTIRGPIPKQTLKTTTKLIQSQLDTTFHMDTYNITQARYHH